MKEISLRTGETAYVDDEDYDAINKHKWYAEKSHGNVYAKTLINGRYQSMHRLITNCPNGLQIDHFNHNGLDNQKINLRICNANQNQANRKTSKNNSSGFKGVYYAKDRGYFRVTITNNNIHIKFGKFNNPVDAAKEYDKKAREIFGEYAKTNF